MRLAGGNQDESATFLTAKPPVKTLLLMTQPWRQRRQSSMEHSPGQKGLSAILLQRRARVVKPKSFSAQLKDVAVVALQRKKGSVRVWSGGGPGLPRTRADRRQSCSSHPCCGLGVLSAGGQQTVAERDVLSWLWSALTMGNCISIPGMVNAITLFRYATTPTSDPSFPSHS